MTKTQTTKRHPADVLAAVPMHPDWRMSAAAAPLTAAQALAAFGRNHDNAVTVPDDLAAAAAVAVLARQRATEADTLTPHPFTTDDLTADDWTDRLTATAAALTAQAHVTKLAEAAAREALTAVGTVLRPALVTMGDQLETWFVAHVEELARAGQTQPGDTIRQADARDELAAEFHRTHAKLMHAGGGHLALGKLDYRAAWWVTHTWTDAQWFELVDSTGPGLKYPEDKRMALAQRIGATPRLARSHAQPWDDFVAMKEPADEARLYDALSKPGATTVMGRPW